jgi:hypothetical protein
MIMVEIKGVFLSTLVKRSSSHALAEYRKLKVALAPSYCLFYLFKELLKAFCSSKRFEVSRKIGILVDRNTPLWWKDSPL